MAPEEPSPATEARERALTWLNLQQATHTIRAQLEARLQAEADLSRLEFELLFRLHFAGRQPVQMAEMADQLNISPSGVTRLTDRLLAKRLISRRVPDENRRVAQLTLTDTGLATLQAADRIFQDVLVNCFDAPLGEEGIHVLRSLLRRILEHDGTWASARCDPQPAD